MSLGFFIFMINACYAYAFFLGGYFVDKQIPNTAMGRPYTAGDSISVFFAVLFGMFALAGASPQINAIVECRAAARLAFDLIKRTPEINQDDQDVKKIKFEGEVEFKKVSFFYPSRVD
jgi:ABC-type multidrug transport system fused ATPase/permease subunit